MTSNIAGMLKCLKIGALICCLTICSSANGHYYSTQSASTENEIVTNEEDTTLYKSLQGIEQVAGLSFNASKLEDVSEDKLAAHTVVKISAASGLSDETENAEAEDAPSQEQAADDREVEETTEAEPVVSEKFANLAVTTVTADWLNIRTEASSDSEIAGKLYPGCAGQIIEENGDWTKITSGSVTGWVSNDFIVKRIDAQNTAQTYGKPYAVINAEGLRVRAAAGTDAKVLGSVDNGKSYPVTSIQDGWIGISFEGVEGFISSDYAAIDYTFGNAISIEEEQAAIAEQERIEREKKAAEEAKKMTVTTTKGAAIQLSESDIILMAAVIQFEAGGGSYDNKLAVANVLINRLKSGRWGSSISSVVYAKGQFSGAANGKVDSILSSGPKKSCIQAARDAVAGANNIGNIMFFCSVKIMDVSKYSSYVVIDDNCFYVR